MNSIKKPDTIIFLHGALGTKKQFEPLLPVFEPPLQVYSFDFEGHGFKSPAEPSVTPHPLEKVSPERFAFSVQTFIQSHTALNTGEL